MDGYVMTVCIGVGVVLGLYIASQISEHIDSRQRHKKFLEDMEKFGKKEKPNGQRGKKDNKNSRGTYIPTSYGYGLLEQRIDHASGRPIRCQPLQIMDKPHYRQQCI